MCLAWYETGSQSNCKYWQNEQLTCSQLWSVNGTKRQASKAMTIIIRIHSSFLIFQKGCSVLQVVHRHSFVLITSKMKAIAMKREVCIQTIAHFSIQGYNEVLGVLFETMMTK